MKREGLRVTAILYPGSVGRAVMTIANGTIRARNGYCFVIFEKAPKASWLKDHALELALSEVKTTRDGKYLTMVEGF